MQNTRTSLAELNTIYLPLLEDLNVSSGREAYRALGKLAHEFRLALPKAHSSKTPAAPRLLWFVHKAPEATSFPSALAPGAFAIRHFSDSGSVKNALEREQPGLALVSSDFPELISHLQNSYPDIDIILCSQGEMRTAIDLMQGHPQIGHFLFEQAASVPFMQQDLLATCEKTLSRDIFGLEKYLDYGTSLVEAVVSGNNSRRQILEMLLSDLQRAGLSSTLSQKARHLADELLMNAIYDAPVDAATGNSRYNHLTRAVTVELEPAEYACFRYGFDGSVLAMSIEDPFGALPRDIILKYLASCYAGQFGKLNEEEGKGGGGMGLYQILSSSDLLIANVAKGKRTELIAIVNVQERLAVQNHAFHYFQADIPTLAEGSAEFEAKEKLLPAIIENLQTLCERSSPEAVAEIKRATARLRAIAPPPVLAAEAEKTLALISDNKNLQRTFRATVGTGHCHTEIYESSADIPAETIPSFVILDDKEIAEVGKLKARFPDCRFVAITNRHTNAATLELKKHDALSQILSLDLPKANLRKLLLTHVVRLVRGEIFGWEHYLAYGAEVKSLKSSEFSSLARPPEELDRLRGLQTALKGFRSYTEQSFAFDSKLFVMNVAWDERLGRQELLELFSPSSADPRVEAFYANAHALVLGSDGEKIGLSLIRFVSTEEIEPFLYTFFMEDR